MSCYYFLNSFIKHGNNDWYIFYFHLSLFLGVKNHSILNCKFTESGNNKFEIVIQLFKLQKQFSKHYK